MFGVYFLSFDDYQIQKREPLKRVNAKEYCQLCTAEISTGRLADIGWFLRRPLPHQYLSGKPMEIVRAVDRIFS
jgi:hypothetical protein